MSCHEFEKDLFVYSELSMEEKKRLDSHLTTCTRCATLFAEISQTQSLIHRVAADEQNLPVHAARLTSTIMRAVVTAAPTQMSFGFILSRARIAMTICSVVMLIAFSLQFLNDASQPRKSNRVAPPGATIVEAKIFLESLAHRQAKRNLVSECRSPFHSGQYYLDCVKSKLK